MQAQLRIRAAAFRNSSRLFHSSTIGRVAVGDSIPSIPVYGKSPGDEVDLAKLTSSGTSVLVFVPGAFSPGCSARHVPGYLSLADKFAAKGVNGIYVISGNDAFVMDSWSKDLGTADGKVTFLADPALNFVKALDLDFDASKFFGGSRSKRAALLVKDGKVSKSWVEPDNTGISVSEAKNVIEEL